MKLDTLWSVKLDSKETATHLTPMSCYVRFQSENRGFVIFIERMFSNHFYKET